MLNTFAKRLSSTMAAQKLIPYEEQAYYAYGLEILISNGLLFASILCIALIIQQILISIYFIALFAVLRLTLGGYHCEKYSICYLVSLGIYLVFITSYIEISILHYERKTIIAFLIISSFLFVFNHIMFCIKSYSKKSTYLFSFKNVMFCVYLMAGMVAIIIGFNKVAYPIAYTMLVTVALLLLKNCKEEKQK